MRAAVRNWSTFQAAVAVGIVALAGTNGSDLDRRMAKLDESARGLESGLDKRLSQMSTDTVRSARSQLESALEVVLS
jgi:hypothetical protein